MTATETVRADAEIAVTGMADAAPLMAPDSPDTAAPAADPAADADGRVGAVWAALNAEPGGSATMIGAASDLNRTVAGKILGQLEADGHARREPGVNDGGRGRAADRWYPVTTNPAATADTAMPTAPTDTADAPAPPPGTPDAAPDATPTPDVDAPDTDAPDADAVPASEVEVVPSGIGSAHPDPADGPTDAEADPTDETAGQVPDGTDNELDTVPDPDPAEPVADDPAWVRACADLSELADLFNGVLTAKEAGNAVMALGCLEMAMTKVASAHRTARAALTGTATPARAVPGAGGGAGIGGSTRPGGLRDLVRAHLIEFPGQEFSPHDMAKALGGRSSGAVANALDRLVQLGDAVLTTERPRRFALAPTVNHAPAHPAPVNAPAVPPASLAPVSAADSADNGDGAATDINGD
ncbi:hypothetical protein [Nonomuraea sp. NPDC050540]|uniref:hypothetical protein n=1 Tax=Nonomuraea sp. NPDC050540 TaxID=3364367 RepID=UPI00378E6187